MSDPFLGEIKLVSFGFPPRGWALCNGQLLPINQNQALFSLLGTMYGGDGTVNFGLPDLRGRVPIHFGNGHTQGERAGEEAHTVTLAELPTHVHVASATNSDVVANRRSSATGALLGPVNNLYASPSGGALTSLHPASLASVGGNQAHTNMMPYLTLNFCIALQGIFPSRN